MAFTVKQWANYPGTPDTVDGPAMIDLEARLSGYTDTQYGNATTFASTAITSATASVYSSGTSYIATAALTVTSLQYASPATTITSFPGTIGHTNFFTGITITGAGTAGTVFLPAAASAVTGKVYVIKNTGTAQIVPSITAISGSVTTGGAVGLTASSLSSLGYVSDATNWWRTF